MATLPRAHAADGEPVTYHLATITELERQLARRFDNYRGQPQTGPMTPAPCPAPRSETGQRAVFAGVDCARRRRLMVWVSEGRCGPTRAAVRWQGTGSCRDDVRLQVGADRKTRRPHLAC